MGGFGPIREILVIGIYVLLFFPVLILLFNLFDRIKNKGNILKVFVCTVLGSLPLVFFSYFQYHSYKSKEQSQVGMYYLTAYPDCWGCKLELLDDNTYVVTDPNKLLEEGQWRYDEGSDYSIVTLNQKGIQLGSGIYQYQRYKLKN